MVGRFRGGHGGGGHDGPKKSPPRETPDIRQLLPAEAGWRSVWVDLDHFAETGEERVFTQPVIAWALREVEVEFGRKSVVSSVSVGREGYPIVDDEIIECVGLLAPGQENAKEHCADRIAEEFRINGYMRRRQRELEDAGSSVDEANALVWREVCEREGWPTDD